MSLRNLSPLDALLFENNPAVTHLENTRGFARWAIGPEDSEWFCMACGSRIDDPDEGCDYCGEGQDDDTDEEEDAA